MRELDSTYSSTQSTGIGVLLLRLIGTLSNGSNAVPPPDYISAPPDGNSPASPNPCRVRQGGTGTGTVLGSWSGSTYTNGASGSGNPCTWRPAATDSASLTPLGPLASTTRGTRPT